MICELTITLRIAVHISCHLKRRRRSFFVLQYYSSAFSPIGIGSRSVQQMSAASKAGHMGPKVVESKRVKVVEMSVKDDTSGWRPLDQGRVQELLDVFKRGEYGTSTLANPSVLQWSSPASDGLLRISNGKSTIAALQQLQSEVNGLQQDSLPEWYVGQLQEDLTMGVRVDVVVFPDEDMAVVQAWGALTHDSDSNRYRATSLETKILLCQRLKSQVKGGSWDLVASHLTKIYGKSKRVTIGRWIAAAKSPLAACSDVLGLWRDRFDLPQGYILTNRFFVGDAAEAKFVLPKDWGLAALKLLFDKLDAGQVAWFTKVALIPSIGLPMLQQVHYYHAEVPQSWLVFIRSCRTRSGKTL